MSQMSIMITTAHSVFAGRDILLIGDAVKLQSSSSILEPPFKRRNRATSKTRASDPRGTLWRQLHQYACDENILEKRAARGGNFPKLYRHWQQTKRPLCGCRTFSLSLIRLSKIRRRYVRRKPNHDRLVALVQNAKRWSRFKPYLVTWSWDLGYSGMR